MSSEILSIGIDIGTSTTQVVFSRLVMENTSSYFTVPNINIIDKRVVYKSDIYTTPLETQKLVDGEAVKKIISTEYEKAGFSPKDTSTGAVIITGESARKENAALVLEKLSEFAGDFVVSTAGPDLESIIAGKGSGAQQHSEENDCVAVNLDVGGGTTNIAVFDCGEAIAKGCYDIGGRQLCLSDDGVVSYISTSVNKIIEYFNIDLRTGKKADLNELKKLSDKMTNLLEQALNISEKTPLLDEVKTANSGDLIITKPIRAVFFSGGVADCIYKTGFEPFEFGDIGVMLGESIRGSLITSSFQLITPRETIRATVVGAGTYTTTISGSTITYTSDIFPLKNVPVLKLNTTEEQRCLDGDSEFLKGQVKWFLEQSDATQFVLALKGRSNPSYNDLRLFARCITQALDDLLLPNEPILVLLERDIAKALGQAIKQALGDKRNVVSIDGIKVEQSNYLDFGKPMMDGLVIPVVVKTLVFG
ncbi:MAG TPA: ethanolamine ammonia-lyase reactivating factor EutA [Clostridia bacterium]|nr:ethanolamine ammonia-lyase reactivating factor EutA [Clostridia bacterium]